MIVDTLLKEYIENNILPLYNNDFSVDGIERINYVLWRSKDIIKQNNLDIDDNILYTVVCYHDLRNNKEEKDHELVSARLMAQDEFLKSFFTGEQITIIKQAIEDQRASFKEEPRNIYGKILSSASRNSSVEQCLARSYKYGKKLKPNASDEELYERAYDALLKKFGENGYARFYFKDSTYEKFLQDIRNLLKDKDKFIQRQREYINNMEVNDEK